MAARKSSKQKAVRFHQHQSFGTKTIYILSALLLVAILAMWYISTNAGTTTSFLPYPGK